MHPLAQSVTDVQEEKQKTEVGPIFAVWFAALSSSCIAKAIVCAYDRRSPFCSLNFTGSEVVTKCVPDEIKVIQVLPQRISCISTCFFNFIIYFFAVAFFVGGPAGLD